MVKTIDDYVQITCERFPQLSEKEIKKILTFGFRMYHYINKLGCDMLIKDDVTLKYTMFTGELGYDALKHYTRGLFKWRMKERMLYRLRKERWDGYYYLGLREDEHLEVQKQIANKTRKNIELTHAFFYKLYKEITHDHSVKHIYKIKYPMQCGYKFYMTKYKVNLFLTPFEYVGENEIKVWNDNK